MRNPGRFFLRIVILGLILSWLWSGAAGQVNPSPAGPSRPGFVTHVADGDTITVRFDDGFPRRVRLIGVNTFERDDPNEEKRYWAEMATRFVVCRLLGKNVRLTFDQEKEDRFGRVLAYVWLDSAEPFNRTLIVEGYSPVFLKYPYRRDYREMFQRAEDEARRLRMGIWGKGEPAPLPLSDAGEHLGQYVAIRFRCGRVSAGRKYWFLWSEDRHFQALVAKGGTPTILPSAGSVGGKELSVTGVLEGDRAFAKIYVLFHRQIVIR